MGKNLKNRNKPLLVKLNRSFDVVTIQIRPSCQELEESLSHTCPQLTDTLKQSFWKSVRHCLMLMIVFFINWSMVLLMFLSLLNQNLTQLLPLLYNRTHPRLKILLCNRSLLVVMKTCILFTCLICASSSLPSPDLPLSLPSPHPNRTKSLPQTSNSTQSLPQNSNSTQSLPQNSNSTQSLPQNSNIPQSLPQNSNSIQAQPQNSNSIQ